MFPQLRSTRRMCGRLLGNNVPARLCLAISLGALLSLVPLEAAAPDEWHDAGGGDGVEYRWTAGFWGTCHIEFRDSTIKGTSWSSEISGAIDYDHTTLNGVERNTLQSFHLTIFDGGTSAGPDVGCERINEVAIQEIRRSPLTAVFDPLNYKTGLSRLIGDSTLNPRQTREGPQVAGRGLSVLSPM